MVVAVAGNGAIVGLIVVGVVVPFQVVVGAGDRRPWLRPVDGVHPVVAASAADPPE